MRLQLLLLMFMCCLFLPKTRAVTIPANTNTARSAASVSNTQLLSLSPKEIQRLTGHKMNLMERLQWKKILQKKLRKTHSQEKNSKDTISSISLLTGIVGFVLLFLFPVGGFLLLLTAIVTGIIGRKNNDNPKSAKKALIGLVLGLAAMGLILIFALAYSGGF